MAQSKPLDGVAGAQELSETVLVSMLERQWIRKALETQRMQITRARTKEMVGSEIHALRGREIEALTVLLQRF